MLPKSLGSGLGPSGAEDSVSLLAGSGVALDREIPSPYRGHPFNGRSDGIEPLKRVEGTTAITWDSSRVSGVCREASGLQVLLENGIEDEKASAGCPQGDRESPLDRP